MKPVALIVCLVIAGFAARPATASRDQSPSISDLLTKYTQRDPATAEAMAAVPDLEAARKELDRIAPKFLVRDKLDERRRWLVAFTLELAQAHSEKQSPASAAMVEWACRHVRRHDPPDDFDYRWQLAATALLEGAINPNVLEVHLRHIAEQFPDEPRFMLGRALAAEQRTAPREVLAQSRAPVPPPGRQATAKPSIDWFREEAARKYQELAMSVESVRAEAHVRRAHVHIERGRHDDALAALSEVERLTKDPALIYLGRLFRGLAFDGLRKPAEAQAAYRSALEISPGAHSATLALATSLFRNGQRVEADRLIAALLKHNDPRVDPWWAYWAGDYRFWYPLISGVRGLLQ